MSEQNRNDVAVFIDFENVYVGVRDKLDANPNFEIIMERCNELGRCILARAYADWYRYPRITSALYANNIEPMYVPTYYYDKDAGRTGRPIKNSADMNLCIDAMRTLFMMPGLKTFVLVTGDRDFIPLVHAIRQHGKDVVIIGVGGAASSHLAQSADEFIFYEHLIGKTIATPAPTAPSRRISDIDEYERPREQRAVAASKPERKVPEVTISEDDVFELLATAIIEARARNMAGIGSLQLLMKELSNGVFRVQSVRDAHGQPIEKFKEFINEAARRGKVVISTDGAANEVFLPGEDPRQLSRLIVTPEKASDRRDHELTAPTTEPAAPGGRGQHNGKSRRRQRRNDASEQSSPNVSQTLEIAPQAAPEYEVAPPVVPVPVPAEAAPVIESSISDGAPTTTTPFSDEERNWVKALVAASDRPLSFQQIHDLLRDKRKREDGIQRTNEELRSLIKLAINTGELQRIGRGNRVSYRVATTAPSTAPDQLLDEPSHDDDLPAAERESPPLAQDAGATTADDGLDIIVPTPPSPKRPKAKPATPAKPAKPVTPARTPARSSSAEDKQKSTSSARKPATKPSNPPSATAVTVAQIPSPFEEPVAPAPAKPAPRRRKKTTE